MNRAVKVDRVKFIFTKNLIILIILSVIIDSNLFAQDRILDSERPGLHKNILYVSIGFAGLYGAANANFERVISERKSGFFKYYLVRIGGGYHGAAYGGPVGPHGVVGFSGLTGTRNNHLELGLGLTAMYDKEAYKSGVSDANYLNEPIPSKFDYVRILPAAVVGYRYQKPGGRFIFRTGAAIPESFYLSFGFCF